MKYSVTKTEKQTILSAKFTPTQVFIEKLESDFQFVGGPVHADAKGRGFQITVYKPGEFSAGTPTLVRVIVKKVRGGRFYKFVFVPNSDKYDEGIDLPPEVLISQLARLAGACSQGVEEWVRTVKSET